ncbi:hypothetical protein ASG73_03145 [Janibacter sp. Soil728]|uniref:hypothetical protein n=1 Tax=Janibacter sp. Soil728 TaxID=1736393 RepID=UPI0006F6B148|nr:hypothetical protein [Janibacter sp. Soil728]KRE39338.1 hypothetical protein ASG73_03145 [Janibacter sp. Soil728]
MRDRTEEPDEGGQVSETNNLRDSDVDADLQQGEGTPPGEDAQQEDQSVAEARISPEEGDVEESVEHSLGEDTQ